MIASKNAPVLCFGDVSLNGKAHTNKQVFEAFISLDAVIYMSICKSGFPFRRLEGLIQQLATGSVHIVKKK